MSQTAFEKMTTENSKSRIASLLRSDLLPLVFLLAVILVTSLYCYNLFTAKNWGYPVAYGGDTVLNLSIEKAFADGSIHPFWSKEVPSLNAPYTANWNDWPITEEGLFFFTGVLGKIFGLFAGLNISLLIAHLLAGATFYLTCRKLRFDQALSVAASVAFAFAPYIFFRGLQHLVLSYYWHVPLILLVSWWAFQPGVLRIGGRRWWFCIAVALISGFQNVYYSWMFLQFLGLAVLHNAFCKRWQAALIPLLLGTVIVAAFLSVNLDTFVYGWMHGKNDHVVNRTLFDLDLFGLRIPSLFFTSEHPWKLFQNFGMKQFYTPMQAHGIGEGNATYLGFVGILGFVGLLAVGMYHFLKGQADKVSPHFWGSIWILAYSVTGGLNMAMGAGGLLLFRGTNRFSIFLLAIALFYLVQVLTKFCRKPWNFGVALLLMVVAIWDQVPAQNSEKRGYIQQTVKSDRDFTRALEEILPSGSMVFQLPVMGFPEYGRLINMEDYSHLRPYLYAKNLRFSAGGDKGRPRETWQETVQSLPVPLMVKELQNLGFAALIVDRKGYDDLGAQMLMNLKKAGFNQIIESRDHEMFGVVLKSTGAPVENDFPLLIYFESGFYGWEKGGKEYATDWSWSSGNASLDLKNPNSIPVTQTISFNLHCMHPCEVKVQIGDFSQNFKLTPEYPALVEIPKIKLAPGSNPMTFTPDRPGQTPGNGDPRIMTFGLFDFRTEVVNVPVSGKKP